MSSKVKKIISSGFEVLRDSAKQLADTVAPGVLIEQALGKPGGSEVTDYLQKIGDPELKGEKLQEKQRELKEKEQKELEEARKLLQAAVPAHMKLPPKPPGLRPYEVTIQEEEQKKAQAIEAAKKNLQPLAMPSSKQARGMLFAKKKSGGKGFEGLAKDTKTG